MTNDITALTTFITALENAGSTVRSSRGQYAARCPAHDDRDPSLSFAEGEGGRVLFTCHGPCDREAILEALGLTFADVTPGGTSRGSETPTRRQAYQSDAGRAGVRFRAGAYQIRRAR